MMQFIIELLIVGIMTMIIGTLISYFLMPSKERNEFKHWNSILFTMFLTGFIVHLSCEIFGVNKYYCKYGYACK